MIATLTEWYLSNLNYWTVMIFMIIESSFIPFPSEIVVTPAAYKAANGEMNIYLVVFFSTIGAILGSLFNYYVAKWLGRPIIYKFANSKFGHLCLIDEQKILQAERYFEKHGSISTFIGRLLPGIRQLISIPAGLAKMKMGKFLLYTTLGAGIWNVILAALGYFLSKVPGIETEEQVLEKVTTYSHEIGWSLLIVVVLAIAYFVFKAYKRKSKQVK